MFEMLQLLHKVVISKSSNSFLDSVLTCCLSQSVQNSSKQVKNTTF